MTIRKLSAGTILFLSVCMTAVAGSRSLAAPEPSTASTIYARALKVMDVLPQPEFVAYRLESDSDDLQFNIVTIDGQVWLRGHAGSEPDHWTLRHRTFDYASEIVTADGRRFVTQRSFFDPTWYGAVRALRLGMFNSQDPAAPRTLPAAESGAPGLKSIGVVSVMGPAVYRIDDRGDATCPNGDPGRALHFTSHEKDPMHQLSDVVVDARSYRFCMVRFLAFGAGAVVVDGFYEQHYGDVGGYWLQTDGVLDGTWRPSRLAHNHHGVWRYHLADITLPKSLSPDIFVNR